MKKSYKLADGSLSDQYEVGDTFVVHQSGQSRYFSEGDVIIFYEDDGSYCPRFSPDKYGEGSPISWHRLLPTEETKRKYQKPSASTFTSSFTKSDLQDGMRVVYRDGSVRAVLGNNLLYFSRQEFNGNGGWKQASYLNSYDKDLHSANYNDHDIIRVEDRDGTLLFERQEAPVKKAVTLELTEEQIRSLKSQGIL